MITTKNLSKRYGDKLAVDDLTFSVAPGEVLGFLGANGAGKSTTMRMIAGFISPSSRASLGVRARYRKGTGGGEILHGIPAGGRAQLRRDDGAANFSISSRMCAANAVNGGAQRRSVVIDRLGWRRSSTRSLKPCPRAFAGASDWRRH